MTHTCSNTRIEKHTHAEVGLHTHPPGCVGHHHPPWGFLHYPCGQCGCSSVMWTPTTPDRPLTHMGGKHTQGIPVGCPAWIAPGLVQVPMGQCSVWAEQRVQCQGPLISGPNLFSHFPLSNFCKFSCCFYTSFQANVSYLAPSKCLCNPQLQFNLTAGHPSVQRYLPRQSPF